MLSCAGEATSRSSIVPLDVLWNQIDIATAGWCWVPRLGARRDAEEELRSAVPPVADYCRSACVCETTRFMKAAFLIPDAWSTTAHGDERLTEPATKASTVPLQASTVDEEAGNVHTTATNACVELDWLPGSVELCVWNHLEAPSKVVAEIEQEIVAAGDVRGVEEALHNSHCAWRAGGEDDIVEASTGVVGGHVEVCLSVSRQPEHMRA